jgi:hypothetical protein
MILKFNIFFEIVSKVISAVEKDLRFKIQKILYH